MNTLNTLTPPPWISGIGREADVDNPCRRAGGNAVSRAGAGANHRHADRAGSAAGRGPDRRQVWAVPAAE